VSDDAPGIPDSHVRAREDACRRRRAGITIGAMTPTSRSTAPLGAALWVTLVAACAVACLSFGVRAAFGLFTDPLTRELGVSREAYAVAIAIQNLAWGLTQPVAGYLADRFGARWVMLAGAVLYALGVAGLAISTSALQIVLCGGVLVGLGMGGASFTTALAALGRVMPQTHRGWALGLGTAASSLGQFVVVPLTQAAIGVDGWRAGAWLMAAAMALAIPAALLVRDRPAGGLAVGGAGPSPLRLLRTALRDRDYALLVLGFFVCGFQLAFIATHFPAYLADRGIHPALASWAIALIGLFNVAGAYLAGTWSARLGKGRLLAGLYVGRAVAIGLFILAPLSPATVLVFSAAMGLMWLSTVPPTSGLVASFFGTRYMAMLFGFVFLSHQVGSFLGVYLGGHLYARTGSYDTVWWLCIVLSMAAAAVNLPIRERPSQRFMALQG